MNLHEARILIIDDDRDIADTLAEIFALSGAESHAVYNGIEGLTTARELNPHVIMCDLAMPECDGWEFIERLHQQPDTADTITVAFSAHGLQEREALAAGFDYFVAKPVLPEVLLEQITNMLKD